MPPINYAAITAKNKENVDKVSDGNTTKYMQVSDVVLIGDGHNSATIKEVEKAGGKGPHKGNITVKKGSGTDPGTLTITGAVRSRGELEIEIKKFSKKKIVYTNPA